MMKRPNKQQNRLLSFISVHEAPNISCIIMKAYIGMAAQHDNGEEYIQMSNENFLPH